MTKKHKTQGKDFRDMTLCYVEPLFRLAYARVGNNLDAEDIVQETYLKAFRAFGTFKGKTSIKNWLSQILINTVRDHFRKNQKELPTIDLDTAIEELPSEPMVSGPEETICENEIDPMLTRALKSIPDEFVTALLLREIHEASYKEIAQILDIPEGTVMSRLHRARTLLRTYLLSKDACLQDKYNRKRGDSPS